MRQNQKVQSLVQNIYAAVAELETLFPGRHFTPDGHMVGSIGECLVAEAYDLELMTASNKGFDAIDKQGRQVEIKATQASAVAFRSAPQFAIVIKLHADGTYSEIYNGPGNLIWELFEGRKVPSNGQFQVSVTKLLVLNAQVGPDHRIKKKED
ncbi:MAG: hypothetical protein C9356_02665 [Oleiphilus sp.]|nr:MAG: hypothetical protein C9356_02665 [Oleiphilus sp.]